MKKDEVIYPALLGVSVMFGVTWLFKDLNAGLNLLTAIGTVGAVIVALFRDELLGAIHPYAADLEPVNLDGTLEPNGDNVWHLRVINRNKKRPLQECVVAVTGVSDRNGKTEMFPVERFLRWAPAESREISPTIWSQRTVDFARINAERTADGEPADEFFLTVFKFRDEKTGEYRMQGGDVPFTVYRGQEMTFFLELRAQDFFQTYSVKVYSLGVSGYLAHTLNVVASKHGWDSRATRISLQRLS